MTQNSNNQDYSNETDGFILGGGTTKRDLTVTGADITLTGSGANTYTFPASTDTLVGRDSTDTLTNKTLTSGTNTFPTFNQNTTGSAATLTTPRTINGTSFNGSANITVPSDITPGTSGNVLTSNGTVWTSAAAAGGGDAQTANPLSQFAATTSAQLAGVISNETGSGLLVFGTAPNITNPTGIVKGDVGLGNVDNTTDAGKPVSTAQQTALNLKANLASPGLTGTPTAPTQTAGNSTTRIATTAFTTTALNLKANLASPTFTGTVSGVTSTMVGLGNVDNTSNATERAATATLTNKDLSSLTNTFQNKLLANVSPSSSFSTTSSSNTYVTSSNTAFTIPTGGATVRVSVDMNTQLTTSGASGQGVLELLDAANAGGSSLQRRVPGVPSNNRYCDASMSYVATLSAGSYTYSLGARTSTGVTTFAVDSSSTPNITVVIL